VQELGPFIFKEELKTVSLRQARKAQLLCLVIIICNQLEV